MVMTSSDSDRGRDGSKCGGRKRGGKSAGQPCTLDAGFGTDHVGVGRCKHHGGSTPTHVVHAQKVMAAQAVATYGIKSDLLPAEALLEEARWSHGHVVWLRDVVQMIDPDALVWSKSEEHEKNAGEFPGVDVKKLAMPNVWLELYHKERRLHLDLVKTIETLKLEDRRQAWTERNSQVLLAMMAAILGDPDMGASEAQRALLPVLLERHVAAIAGRTTA